MTAPRMPASVALSLALHAGGLGAFLMLGRSGPVQTQQIVDGVDLLIQAPKPRPGADVPKPKLSTMDFLKLALPAAPRASAPAALQLKTPEVRKIALAEPKLEERARKDMGPKLEALDLGRKADAAKIEAKLEGRRQALATLASMPKLEEVGRRRVKNLPEALALEDKRREAAAAAGAGLALGAGAPSRRQAVAAMQTLQEAAPPPRGGAAERKGLAGLLPEPALEAKRQPVAAGPKLAPPPGEAPKVERRQAQAASASRKSVEIEGPLADRKVVAPVVPAFPDWLKSQGILEAAVSIRFTVNEAGDVMPGLQVVSGSGYGRLDRLAMDALKGWQFEAKPGAGVQWGVITFRFVLE